MLFRSSDTTILRPEISGCTENRSVRLINTRNNRCVAGDVDIIVSVVDSTRATASATVKIVDNGTVCGGVIPPSLAVSPSQLTVQAEGANEATSNQAVITGGSGSYIATSSDPSRATATISGNVVTVKGGVAPGQAVITIRDQSNPERRADITVTVL